MNQIIIKFAKGDTEPFTTRINANVTLTFYPDDFSYTIRAWDRIVTDSVSCKTISSSQACINRSLGLLARTKVKLIAA